MMKRNKKSTSVFDPKKMLLSEQSPFTVKEAYKSLRTNVMFSLPGNDSKCIGVVSADRGDGKSSVALNLAISFAQINKKVIIVDCDLRLPTVASKLGIEAKPGLSNFLSGTQDSEKPMIRRSKTYGIDIMTAGDIPPDPTILLESKQMTSFVEFLKKYYDFIILDFPPVTIVSDAVMLANIVDGYLMVVRHCESECSKINEMLRQLDFAGAKALGFVYNGVDEHRKYYKRSKYSKYYYNSYYYKK
ncbi:MAG: CpsD/CapB family tyrosine-protein kinase [Ruminococcus sp.]|nr:CpsD/CapB family tyrosine-protein kinase [Ruminococcus sp.]